MTAQHPADRPAPAGPVRREHRPELQGLRALAVGLVVVYHVWLGRISGGVDALFLLSGFLVTGRLAGAAQGGRIELGPLWGRSIRRLFPAALTVLLAVTGLSILLLPVDRWPRTGQDVFAALFSVENWRPAAGYFAQDDTASVVQHYWSLSVLGQFLLVWPLLAAGVAFVAARIRRPVRASLAVVLAVVFAGSLAYSVHLTSADQPAAYFDSLARGWEFALGGLLALAIDAVSRPRGLRIVAGWAGVAGLVSCGLVLDAGRVFPGGAALWPTLSAALVIFAGATGSRLGADRVLGSRPAAYLGDLSYPLYLWHWPVLVFYLLVRHREQVGPLGGLVVAGASVVLAVLTRHLVENPIRRSALGTTTRWGTPRFALVLMLPVLLVAGTWQVVDLRKADLATGPTATAAPATAPTTGPTAGSAGGPSVIAVPDDWARIADADCVRSALDAELEMCSSRTTGPPAKRIVVVGDSHIQQYLAALGPIAAKHDYQITFMLKGACPFSTTADAMPGDPACIAWNAAAEREITDRHPDAVLTLASRDVRPGLTEQTPPGFVDQWKKLDQAGIPVFAVRDNPRLGFSPPECIRAHGSESSRCGVPRDQLLAGTPPYDKIAGIPANVTFFDLSDYFCGRLECRAVVGNVLVYMDDNHVTGTFMATLAPVLERAMTAALGW
ncbi:acyltransferase family protein [Amycolatopsis sp. PS_44_ISF1]|uniref:acyltransferase family protein n=1 Tax=Amycolatopsis sp. PS_44_ISF1 TaxID=2974917 RepID=UPI0028E06FDF|nr:acyltransferase family protein [Amycolatopsis sp. PS_44_ISF1]MDT8914708.1 acyltransferase [Amycolatopsis sp. PS_44_ISF1]